MKHILLPHGIMSIPNRLFANIPDVDPNFDDEDLTDENSFPVFNSRRQARKEYERRKKGK